MAQFKKVRRKLSRDKGKSYDLNAAEPCFVVRYLGMKTVSGDFGQGSDLSVGIELCSECVAELQEDKVVKKVSLLISTNIARGLTIIDWLSKKEQATFQLHNIAFCTTDQGKPTMFSFIGKREEVLQCHVFDCEKEEKANEVCEALSSAFTTAHDNWCRSKKRSDERKKSRDLVMTRNFPDAGKSFYSITS